MLKRISAAVLAIMLCMVFSGCNFIGSDIDSLMRPPKPSGVMYPVQMALERAVKGDFVLKYPRMGNYHSAFVFSDIDQDGKDEAFAFYTTQSDSTAYIHMNLIVQTEHGWESVHDVQLAGDGVERLEFVDLNNDGNLEVIVGWYIYSTIDKQLAVYSISDNKIVQKMQEKYTQFAIYDLDSDSYPELLLIAHNSAEKTSTAKLFSVQEDGVSEKGSCMLDGNVSSYYPPIVSKLRGGKPAIYVDAAKGSGTIITELIYYDDFKLKNPFYELGNNITQRRSPAVCRDINADGVIDLPYMQPFLGYEELSSDNSPYITTWRSYDGQRFETTLIAYMDYSGGYYLSLKSNWIGFVTLTIKDSVRTFRLWDHVKNGPSNQVLLEIQILPTNTWQNASDMYSDYILLESTEDYVYIAKLGQGLGEYQLSLEELKSSFHLIK